MDALLLVDGGKLGYVQGDVLQFYGLYHGKPPQITMWRIYVFFFQNPSKTDSVLPRLKVQGHYTKMMNYILGYGIPNLLGGGGIQ